MSAKYSTGDRSETTLWDRDRRFLLASWTTKPFVGHRHRHETVEHRIVLEYIHEVGADVRHEVRSVDSDKFPDSWTVAESIEVRDYGATQDRRRHARWLK